MGYKYELAIWIPVNNHTAYNSGYRYEQVWFGNSRIKLWWAMRKYKKMTGCMRLEIR